MENGCCECPSLADTKIVSTDQRKSKFYQEISTEMIGNSLTIRVEKDPLKKLKKLRNNWEPPCDCDMVEIRRPKRGEESAKIVNGGDNNQVLFKVFSKTRLPKDQSNYKPQAIAYKVGACNGGETSNDQCRTITVYPQMGGPGSQEVHSDHITEGNEDIFLLKIKKKPDTLDPKLRNVELELRTPRPPTPELTPTETKEDKEDKVNTIKDAGKLGNDKKEKNKKGKKVKGKK